MYSRIILVLLLLLLPTASILAQDPGRYDVDDSLIVTKNTPVTIRYTLRNAEGLTLQLIPSDSLRIISGPILRTTPELDTDGNRVNGTDRTFSYLVNPKYTGAIKVPSVAVAGVASQDANFAFYFTSDCNTVNYPNKPDRDKEAPGTQHPDVTTPDTSEDDSSSAWARRGVSFTVEDSSIVSEDKPFIVRYILRNIKGSDFEVVRISGEIEIISGPTTYVDHPIATVNGQQVSVTDHVYQYVMKANRAGSIQLPTAAISIHLKTGDTVTMYTNPKEVTIPRGSRSAKHKHTTTPHHHKAAKATTDANGFTPL